MYKESDLQLVVDAKATLGEGPSWDHKRKVLYWVDIESGKIITYDPASGESSEIAAGQRVGAVVPTQSGELLAALEQGFYSVDPSTGKLTQLIDPESELTDNRFNDGKCDPKGRFWAGTMSLIGKEHTGSLYVMDTDRSVRKVFDGVTISNGLGWSPDHKTMYYIDSPTKQVVAFDYEAESGEITNRRTVVVIQEGEGIPDGMTVDAEGMLWVAQWGGYKVSRWNPHTGEKISEIPVPVKRVTSCCFGGENLDELYITTASIGMDDEEWKEQPHAGGLFRLQTKVKGLPTYKFQG